MIDIRLFGTFSITASGTQRQVELSRSLQLLFAFLLLHRGRLHQREILGSLLWADRPDVQARKCLNTALWRLRKSLDLAGGNSRTILYATNAGEVGFALDAGVCLDVACFEENIRHILSKNTGEMTAKDADKLIEAHRLYVGDLLEGFFDDWILRERERLRALCMRGLYRMMEYNARAGRLDAAIDNAETLLQLEPLREDLHRRLMRLLTAAGRRAIAASRYKSLCTLLRNEFGISPLEETQALYRQIVREEDTSALPQQETYTDPSDIENACRLLDTAMQSFETLQAQISQVLTAFHRFSNPRS